MGKSIAYVESPLGHRQSYQEIISSAGGYESVIEKEGLLVFLRLVLSKRLIFTTMESSFVFSFFIGLVRLCIRKKTSMIFMNPINFMGEGGYKKKIKIKMVRFLRWTSNVRLITIIPFYLDDRISMYADDWIYDPQFWDLRYLGGEGYVGERQYLNCKPTLLFIGVMSEDKGYDFLAKTIIKYPDLIEMFSVKIYARPVGRGADYVEELKEIGVDVRLGYLSDDELNEQVYNSDVLWGCYGDRYNSSSGVFGRAFQLSKNIIIRKGSLIDAISTELNFDVGSVEFGDVAGLYQLLLSEFSKKHQAGVGGENISREKEVEKIMYSSLKVINK